MNNSDYQILQHLLTYCEDIASCIIRFGKRFDDFADDIHYRHSVSMCILQIGELSNKLSEDFRNDTKDLIPWREIRGMRNILAHNYGESDTESLWMTAISDIPTVADFCRKQIDWYKENIGEKK